MEIKIVKCLTDNYSYIIFDKENLLSAVVDPSEASSIIKEIEKTHFCSSEPARISINMSTKTKA